MLTHDLHIIPPYLSLSRRVPTTPPTTNENFHSGYSRLTVNLRSAGHLFSLLIALRRPFPVWQFPLCRYRHGYPRPTRSHSARSNHRAPFFSPCWYLLRTSYVPISSGPMVESYEHHSFQSPKNWKALDPTVMSWTTCCTTTMNSYARFQGAAQRRPVRRCLYQFRQRSLVKPCYSREPQGIAKQFWLWFSLLDKKIACYFSFTFIFPLSSFNSGSSSTASRKTPPSSPQPVREPSPHRTDSEAKDR